MIDRLKSNTYKGSRIKEEAREAGESGVWVGSSESSIAGGEMRRVEGMGEERARVESKDEDVTPTAVAKEVIGLRPCARYPNRGRRREPTGHPAEGRRREGFAVAEGGDDWRRPSVAAPLPRAPPIREGVSRPFVGAPLLLSPREDRARGVQQRDADPFEIRVSYRAIGPRWPFFAALPLPPPLLLFYPSANSKGRACLRRDFAPPRAKIQRIWQ